MLGGTVDKHFLIFPGKAQTSLGFQIPVFLGTGV